MRKRIRSVARETEKGCRWKTLRRAARVVRGR